MASIPKYTPRRGFAVIHRPNAAQIMPQFDMHFGSMGGLPPAVAWAMRRKAVRPLAFTEAWAMRRKTVRPLALNGALQLRMGGSNEDTPATGRIREKNLIAAPAHVTQVHLSLRPRTWVLNFELLEHHFQACSPHSVSSIGKLHVSAWQPSLCIPGSIY